MGHSPDISTSHSEDCQAWPPLCTRQSLAGVIRRGSCENVYSTEAAQRNPLHHIYTHKRTQAHADTHACIGGSILCNNILCLAISMPSLTFRNVTHYHVRSLQILKGGLVQLLRDECVDVCLTYITDTCMFHNVHWCVLILLVCSYVVKGL